MGRPLKHGLDYFPLDVDMADDSAVAAIEAEWGLEGFAVVIKLWQRIYRNGYYINWDERECKIMARRLGLAPDTLAKIVESCVCEGVFHRGLFESGILTSSGIQRRFLRITARRNDAVIPPEHQLLHTETTDDDVFLHAESTQSKVKERKGKQRATALEDSHPQYSLPECLRNATDGVSSWFAPDDSAHETPASAFWSTVEVARGGIVPERDRLTFCAAVSDTCPAGCTHSPDEIDHCLTTLCRAVGKTNGRPTPLFRRIAEEDR